MTKSKKKIFGIFNKPTFFCKNSLFEDAVHLIIPERKHQEEIKELFLMATVKYDYLLKDEKSFNYFSSGYMFNIDRMLNKCKNLRFKNNNNFNVKIEDLRKVSMDVKSIQYLKSIFENIFEVKNNSYDEIFNKYNDENVENNFLSFIKGYYEAYQKSREILMFIEKDYLDNERELSYSLYLGWDFLSTELIILDSESKKLIKNYINEEN